MLAVAPTRGIVRVNHLFDNSFVILAAYSIDAVAVTLLDIVNLRRRCPAGAPHAIQQRLLSHFLSFLLPTFLPTILGGLNHALNRRQLRARRLGLGLFSCSHALVGIHIPGNGWRHLAFFHSFECNAVTEPVLAALLEDVGSDE